MLSYVGVNSLLVLCWTQEKISEAGAIPLLVELRREGSESMKEAAAKTLGYLAENEANKVLELDRGCHIVYLLRQVLGLTLLQIIG